MSIEYKLSYTAVDINEKLGKIDNLAEKSAIPKRLSDLINNMNLSDFDNDMNLSDFENDCGYIYNTGEVEGYDSHAEGEHTTTYGDYSHAEGDGTHAYGECSHAEGEETYAYGECSHAEGYYTHAGEEEEDEENGKYAHAEGYYTHAYGEGSHAEGYETCADGAYSHAEGDNTYACGDYQHVQGKYNVKDENGVYAHIVGNGTAHNARSNAYTLDWSGNGWFAGSVECTNLILKSPNGTRYQITVDDNGTLTTSAVV